MNSYEFNIKEYEEATFGLSAIEEAMYGRLTRLYIWLEGPISDNSESIKKAIRATTLEEQAAVLSVLMQLFDYNNGVWHHEQCDVLLRKARKGKPAGPRVSLPDWIPEDVWAEFVEMRKKVKAPLTERAAQLLIGKLEKMMQAGQTPRAVLEQSIMNSWKGVFEVRDEGGRRSFDEKSNARRNAYEVLTGRQAPRESHFPEVVNGHVKFLG